MFKILRKRELAPDIYLFEVEAPRVAKTANPGQFVIVRAYDKGERIPLTIADYDKRTGSVTIVIQALGASTRVICSFEEGDSFVDFAGPLGQPSDFIHFDPDKINGKRFLFVAGGVGAAPIYPQLKYLKERGAVLDVIIGARSKELLILLDEIREKVDNLYVATNDGSFGYKGFVTCVLEELISKGNQYDQVIAIGPMVMMKSVAESTKKYSIPTIVSLNTLMIDGTGMCGACRVTVNGKIRFTCVDGPEFNAHEVDFDEAMLRLNMYRSEEQKRLVDIERKHHKCKIGRTM
ncbi:sulfide/dihydroorotate dehydrogenase-like FAD/NAD-binding protein [Tenuifilum thalassicum]|uniref:Sulfide/dihydroorotate dehydrogenase-like FAD/NAD-binding protein n=1 Tax=Tenuifilum thalassicum TaxID=2590900 RepID=A0A7D4CQN4_9BACT|nr:sulfide/dihydroorotate dehydrogenase-like FAD/NAD-binding protein [Tenuifilum thalassicum]QKG79545.1 sulfide/dihydroorotate dehydrogenase-like FAD/NAD-binding protein [Tenuifilum thalassicum]